MAKNILIKNIITVIFLCFLFSCSDNKINIRDKEITIKMVTHGQATDPFWSVVSNGAKDAAKKLGVNLHYQSPQNFDMITMSQMIDAVVATKPDGLIISVPDIPALRKSVVSASKNNIPIIVINAGVDIMKEADILTYVGQSEYEAGLKAADEMLKYNVKSVLCINHEIGNISLDQREKGFRKILKENNVVIKTVPIDASDPSETQEVVRAFINSNKKVDGILTLGPLGAVPILKLLKEIDTQKKIKLATFDFTPEIIDGIMDGYIVFALDQQQYLQGYLPVVLMNLYITNKNPPAYKKLETGPSIINIENAEDVLALSKKGSR
ncbi:MAG: LacI family transcriptional regulator [Candidatus Marinimicrobia bacterium]|nr:LacI family transcriptional regulator [Candidatus Neomarinimicrobiota bacterium]